MKMPTERIIIDTGNESKVRVVGSLKLCHICNVNYSISSPCVMCQMRISEEKKDDDETG